MRELIGVVRAVAPTLITVLLTGESGTGKEVFARLIHDWSPRANNPFITVNCGAIPEGLIESELFGHEKGSFTGATGERKGFFEAARGGTIFLDEIGEMPLSAQVKLLRVLETGKFTRVGSASERTTDARIIAATNRDLELEVHSGRFRTDLFYRLRAVMLRLPPLRNRREDIPTLANSILTDLVSRHSLPYKPHLDSEAIERLTLAEWQGNIRELRNTLEQLAVMSFAPNNSRSNGTINAADVDAILQSHHSFQWNTEPPLAQNKYPIIQLQQSGQTPTELALIYRALLELRADLAEIKEQLFHNNTSDARALAVSSTNNLSMGKKEFNLEQREQALIAEAMQTFGGDRTAVANALGISERTLYRKLQQSK